MTLEDETGAANIIATEMGVGLKSTSGPVLERAGAKRGTAARSKKAVALA